MIAPLTRSTVRGAIWYQGEANVKWNPTYYSCHIAAQAQDWKETFGDGIESAGVEFPFGIVQVFIHVTSVEAMTINLFCEEDWAD
jgi:sialate O-acetylesterase